MLGTPTAAAENADRTRDWTAAISLALDRYANDAELEDALAPIVAAIDALTPGWRVFIWRRADHDADDFVVHGGDPAPRARHEIAVAVESAMREGCREFLTFEAEDGPGGDLVAAPLVVTDHHLVGVLALEARDEPDREPPGLSGPLLTLARVASLMVEDRLSIASAESRGSMLRGVLDTVPEAVIRTDADGRMLSLNRAAEEMFGWSEAELCGENVNRLMPEPYASAHDGYIEHYLSSGERRSTNWRRRFHGLRRDGEIFPVEIAIADADSNGDRGFVGMIRDVSDRVAAEAGNHALRERMEEAGRLSALGEMAATVAHEVNQPLTALGNYLDAAAARLEAGASAEETLPLIEKAREMAAMGGEVIGRVKQLTRNAPFERTPVQINDVLEDALGHLDPAAARVGAVITRRFARDLPEIPVDRVQLQQVIVNLIRNALEAVEDAEERVVTISTARAETDEALVIEVVDTGPGPPGAGAGDIFESFITTRSDGLGIGLSISRRIVEAHGGRIQLLAAETGGAAARVELPLTESGHD
ncbi:PAS domain-containing sensor histidine kinase [Marinicauda salina]|uniref:Sensor protein FixL n=1 Tax=Marinicauda salina TaxID=2135793 RepID=A0A2U2BX06_9PROT|nr:PAS domain S-box protein [Marinicauda salina]PWE18509.1 PAS domain-containing sensor histidine kinase [Marinicauda salina]